MKVTTRKDQVDFPKKTQNNASQPAQRIRSNCK